MSRRVISINHGWSFKQADQDEPGFLPVSQFPTNVHLDLLAHDLIPDPYVEKNENSVQWVGEKSWLYRTTFPTPHISCQKAVLAFEGLDTYATVRLNGVAILKIGNMFVPERVDVTGSLSIGDGELNVLEITFDSTYLIGKKLKEKYPNHYWGCWSGDPSRLAVRKAQYHYGWDWGPTLLTCGPWRPITLELYSARISDLSFTTNVHESLKTAEIVARAEIEGQAPEVMFEITHKGKKIAEDVVAADSSGIASTTFTTQSPKLWYPHSYGEQPLYHLTATLRHGTTTLDTCEKRFGLRRARVIQSQLKEAPGTSFYFEINNISIFCRGSNWIPADMFIPRIIPQRYHDWVRMAVEGNQNMLRVWGGGIYEEQALYDACDEMGVLVWQDFMFACGNYPAFPDFLDLVKREAIANLKILRHHPSIVLYAGNNEDYQYCESENLEYDPQNHDPESWLCTSFPARYIYEKILPEITSTLAPDTYYQPSSPFGGKTTADPTIGDIHQWNIWHGNQNPYQDFPSLSGRFVTEFGMEALPSISTIETFLPGKSNPECYALSSTMDFHNKALGQIRRLAMYMSENLRYNFEPVENYVYYTQLMQAECISTAYRSFKRNWKGPGREECGGALVWQLNDCWPGTSWSIADYYLRPKLAYFAMKRELQPLTIGLQRNVKTVSNDKSTSASTKTVHALEMWAVNFSLDPIPAYHKIRFINLRTNKQYALKNQNPTPTLTPNQSTEITTFTWDNHDAQLDQTVVAAYLYSSTTHTQIARAVNWPEPLKHLHFPKPTNIKITLIDTNNAMIGEPCAIKVSSDVCIKGLQIEYTGDSEGVRFEDNGIDIVPEEDVVVGVKGLKVGDGKNLRFKYLGMDDC